MKNPIIDRKLKITGKKNCNEQKEEESFNIYEFFRCQFLKVEIGKQKLKLL